MPQTQEEFEFRSKFAIRMGKALVDNLWSHPIFRWKHTGVEHRLTEGQRRALAGRTDDKALDIRLTPDKELNLLLNSFGKFQAEEKFMGRQWYPSDSSLRKAIQTAHCDPTGFTAEESGYIQHLPWIHYKSLADSGKRVAVVMYVAWKPERLYMDWIDHNRQYMNFVPMSPGDSVGGSDKDIARVHLGRFKTLAQFLVQDLNVPAGYPGIAQAVARALKEMDLCFTTGEGFQDRWAEQVRGTDFKVPYELQPGDRQWLSGIDALAKQWRNGNESE